MDVCMCMCVCICQRPIANKHKYKLMTTMKRPTEQNSYRDSVCFTLYT